MSQDVAAYRGPGEMEKREMKTMRQRIMELAYMVTDGKISKLEAERILQEEEHAGELYDDLDGVTILGAECRWLKR